MRLKLIPLLFLYACANLQNANFKPMLDQYNAPSGAEFQQQRETNCESQPVYVFGEFKGYRTVCR